MSSVYNIANHLSSLFLNKKRIGYSGCLGINNLGDDAIFLAYTKLFSHFALMPISFKLCMLEQMLSMSFYQAKCLGGGTLIGGSPSLFEKIMKNCRFSFALGTGVSDSDFWKDYNINWELSDWKEVLSKMNFIGVRGPRSYSRLSNIGIKSEIVGDTALILSKTNFIPKKREKNLLLNVGTSNNYVFGEEFVIMNVIIDLAHSLLESGWKITIIYVWPPDRVIALNLFHALNKKMYYNKVFFINECLNYYNYISLAEIADVLLGFKLHTIVLGHCVGTPAIMLGYNDKCFDYMDSMGLTTYCHRTDQLNIALLRQQLIEIHDNFKEYQSYLHNWTNYYQNKLGSSAKIISKMINELN